MIFTHGLSPRSTASVTSKPELMCVCVCVVCARARGSVVGLKSVASLET